MLHPLPKKLGKNPLELSSHSKSAGRRKRGCRAWDRAFWLPVLDCNGVGHFLHDFLARAVFYWAVQE